MNKPSQVIVIVEDEHHKQVIYKYLKIRNLKQHAIRIEMSPSGEGSAENWVRKKFVKEVSTYRSRNRYAQTALIVAIDADTGSVQDRLKQLDQELTDNGKERVTPEAERIARLVPKRNIETWILCLNEENVDEETDYKSTRNDWNNLIPQAAESLSDWRSKAEPPKFCVDSLRCGIGELNHLEF
jgi:hypothetical protein